MDKELERAAKFYGRVGMQPHRLGLVWHDGHWYFTCIARPSIAPDLLARRILEGWLREWLTRITGTYVGTSGVCANAQMTTSPQDNKCPKELAAEWFFDSQDTLLGNLLDAAEKVQAEIEKESNASPIDHNDMVGPPAKPIKEP